MLSERRDDLAYERARLLNRLHGFLRDRIPGGAPTGLSADKAAALLRTVRPTTATQACRRDPARDLLADLRRIDQRLKDNEAQTRDALAATGSTFTQIHGLRTALAAKILSHVGDIAKNDGLLYVVLDGTLIPMDRVAGSSRVSRVAGVERPVGLLGSVGRGWPWRGGRPGGGSSEAWSRSSRS
ncbi:hypothetical protein [Actinoallomurus acanthiterrae]